MGSYLYRSFPYRKPPELAGGAPFDAQVVIVGAGPVGLTAALELAQRGLRVLLLDDSDRVSTGSRAICWAKRTLEIWDRLGVAQRMVEKGVTWQTGRVFHGAEELYSFDLLPEGGHKMPAFINLQQYYVEEFLVARTADFPGLIELRWKNRVTGVQNRGDGVVLTVETPDGDYRLEAPWVLAADGARSTVRQALGLAMTGQVFEERFLIADVRMEADFRSERRFWFEPSFHAGDSALLHRQPDNIFRLDFQLGPDADPEVEKQPEKVIPRVQAAVGRVPFELEWCSVYSFRCARIERFVEGRVLFVGDAAHVVSPFGARGGNGGIQDVDNLCWKLETVIRGVAPLRLLDSYDEERGLGCAENIAHASRTTAFMTPKTPAERRFRDAVLGLARRHPFARALVNSGRLSRPCSLAGLSLQTADAEAFDCALEPGAPCLDAPLTTSDGRPVWLLEQLGRGFTLLAFGETPQALPDGSNDLPLTALRIARQAHDGALLDREGLATARYGAAAGTTYLIRPDHHVAARFARLEPPALGRALDRALARGTA